MRVVYTSRAAALSALAMFVLMQWWPEYFMAPGGPQPGNPVQHDPRQVLHSAKNKVWRASPALAYHDEPPEEHRPKKTVQIRAVARIMKEPGRIKELMAHSKHMKTLASTVKDIHEHVMNGDVLSALAHSQVLANLTRGIDLMSFSASAATLSMLMGQPVLAEFAALVQRKDYLGAWRLTQRMDFRRVAMKMVGGNVAATP
mmetsp:Transcript_67182/g.194272  ORF Transcript_67182/g.194272 Transcript_67182/m.194272 type:complete len:201 (-) Transcript_67182:189-791(-)